MKKFRPMHRSPGSIATWRKTSKFTIPLFFTSKYNILWRRQHFSSLTMAHVTTTIWASGRKSSNQRPKFRLRKFLSSLQWAFRPVVRIGSFYSKLKTSHRVSLFLTHSGFLWIIWVLQLHSLAFQSFFNVIIKTLPKTACYTLVNKHRTARFEWISWSTQ